MIRDNWRIILLVVFVVAAGVALFVPGFGLGESGAVNATGTNAGSGPTNLQYGLELSGGTQIRAPLVGLTAQDVNVTPGAQGNLTSAVADDLGVSVTDVKVRVGNGSATIEVFSKNVTRQAFASALESAGHPVGQDDIRAGVTGQTYESAV